MSDAHESPSLFDKSRRPFLLRKLHSLTGVLPVGGFMVFHLWTNAKAMQGQELFDDAVADISHMPFLGLLEASILLPLLFHAVWGIKIALEGKPNVGKYTFSRNWMYSFQRITGILAFLFIGYHLWGYWGQRVADNMAPREFYPSLCANLSSTMNGIPVVGLIYLVGIAACSFHLANGLWGFCFSWGITLSRRSQRLSAVVFGLLGAAIFVLGASTVIYFATGSRINLQGYFGGDHDGTTRTCADLAQAKASPVEAPAVPAIDP